MREEVKGLDVLIKPFVGENKKITKCATRSLIAPGENYGSIMLAVDLVLDGKEELHLVAKLCPTSEFIKQMFNIGVTFKKEVLTYSTIVPSLRDFQKRNGCPPMESFAKYYGSRLSLSTEGSEVDDDCCLLLENVKVKGFTIEDRMKGFNLDCATFLVKDLATFHAVPIAMKLKEPERFRKDILQHISVDSFTEQGFTPEMATRTIDEFVERLKAVENKYTPHIDKVEAVMRGSYMNFYNVSNDINEPLATCVHADFWTNNTMIKLDDKGKMIANCLVDFQLISYGNPMNDLSFFLFSSVEIEVLKDNYTKLVDLYYDTFIQVLKDLHLTAEELKMFPKSLLESEITRAMKRLEMYHVLFMLTPIYTRKEKATELSELSEEAINDRSKLDHEKYYKKLMFVLDQFVEKGWIQL